MTLLVNSFEGGTAAVAVTTGNSGAASGNALDGAAASGGGSAPAYDGTYGAAHGSLSCLIQTAASGQSQVWWTTSMGTQAQVWFRVYLYFAAFPAGQTRIFYAGGASNGCYCAVNPSGKLLMVQSNGSGITASAAAIPLGQWFRVEGFVLGTGNSTGQTEVRLYDSMDSAVATEINTSPATLATQATLTGYYFGVSVNEPSAQYWMDDLGLSSTGYAGPVISYSGVTLAPSAAGGSQRAGSPAAGAQFTPAAAGAPAGSVTAGVQLTLSCTGIAAGVAGAAAAGFALTPSSAGGYSTRSGPARSGPVLAPSAAGTAVGTGGTAVTDLPVLMIAVTRVHQNTDAGHLPDVTPGEAFWVLPGDAPGLVAAGQAYYAPPATASPPAEPSWTAHGSPGAGAGTSNSSPPAPATVSTADGGPAAGVPSGGFDGGNAGSIPAGILNGGHAAPTAGGT